MSKLHVGALGICLLASPSAAQCVALEWDPMLGEPICTAFASSSGGGPVGGAGGSCETIRTGGQFGSAGTSCAGGSRPVYDPSGNGGPSVSDATAAVFGVTGGVLGMGVGAATGDPAVGAMGVAAFGSAVASGISSGVFGGSDGGNGTDGGGVNGAGVGP